MGTWLPVVVAFGLPVFFLPNLIDQFILPRASLVIAGACLGAGLALLTPDRPSLGRLRWPLIAAAAAAALAFGFSVSPATFVLGTSIASLEALQQLVTSVPFRPDGNVGNAGILAALIAMAVPLAISRALRGGLFVFAWWLGVVALGAGLYASTSRAGGLGVLAGCLALVVFRLKGRPALFVAAAAGGLVALALLAILLSPLRELNGDPGPAR
ncbi:MAG: hypothetical protein E6I72_05860, partial [Chloroflexi bacterium]